MLAVYPDDGVVVAVMANLGQAKLRNRTEPDRGRPKPAMVKSPLRGYGSKSKSRIVGPHPGVKYAVPRGSAETTPP